MKIHIVDEDHVAANSFNQHRKNTGPEDICIDIFGESMTEYLQKLNAASLGRYELDDYDMQVLAIAMEQYASCIAGDLRK